MSRTGTDPGLAKAARLVSVGSEPEGSSVFEDGHPSPLAIVRGEALRRNIRLMASFCSDNEVRLSPHNKTAMSEYVARLQLEAGAWAITVATPAQARLAIGWGMDAILIANQVIDDAGIAWVDSVLAEPEPGPEIYLHIDSPAGAERLAKGLRRSRGTGRRPKVLLEIGTDGGRCGLRRNEDALALAEAMTTLAQLELVGVTAFEGLIGYDRTLEQRQSAAALAARAASVGCELARTGLLGDERLISLGGSLFFADVIDSFNATEARTHGFEFVARSGCYAFHDLGIYAGKSPLDQPGSPEPLRPALEVWGTILSTPEPGLAICDVGRRDIGTDAGPPIPIEIRTSDGHPKAAPTGIEVHALNDQHGHLRILNDATVEIGDRIGFGVSHPCSTLDRWNTLPIVDDAYVLENYLHTSLG